MMDDKVALKYIMANKVSRKYYTLRLDMKSKMEFYGRLREMMREQRQERWERQKRQLLAFLKGLK